MQSKFFLRLEESHDHSRSARYQKCAGDRLAENAGNGQSGDSRPLNRGRAATSRVATRQSVSQLGNCQAFREIRAFLDRVGKVGFAFLLRRVWMRNCEPRLNQARAVFVLSQDFPSGKTTRNANTRHQFRWSMCVPTSEQPVDDDVRVVADLEPEVDGLVEM